jgi:hypothetical protein
MIRFVTVIRATIGRSNPRKKYESRQYCRNDIRLTFDLCRLRAIGYTNTTSAASTTGSTRIARTHRRVAAQSG